MTSYHSNYILDFDSQHFKSWKFLYNDIKNYCGLTLVISSTKKVYNDRKYYDLSNMGSQSILILE